MKKQIKIFLGILLVSLVFLPFRVDAKEKVSLYLFYGDGCPHCGAEEKFLKKYENDINIIKKEVWYHSDNEELLEKVKAVYNIEAKGVPITIIGNTYFVGYSDTIKNDIINAIKFYKKDNRYVNNVNKIIEEDVDEIDITDYYSAEAKKINDKLYIDVPLIGKINLKNVSISTAAVLIGLVDGFNPCAMWVLLFLISLLIGMKDKKRMWILGLTFLGTSALVYMLIMFSWLNIVVKVSTSILIRNIIGIVAIIGGGVNLVSYFKSNDSGCTVVDDKKRKKIFTAIKKFTSEKNFLLAICGVMALAVSVNLVELACSAGLPLVFTQLLAVNNISGIEGILYTITYVIFFLIDDLIIFFIAMFTMNVTGISTKYNKYSHLIGGLVMLIVGILLIFNYELLTFGL